MMRFREMVSLIPRLSSFAVSGTPAKTQIADLIHVLKYVSFIINLIYWHQLTSNKHRFLRVDKIVGGPRLWKRLLKPGFADDFVEFLQRYAIRYSVYSEQYLLSLV
jgi:E3 ubiquitin-protein ligase SHPRH